MVKIRGIGKKKITREVDLPSGVNAAINAGFLKVAGPKGESARELKQHNISVKIEDKKIILESSGGTKTDKKMMGSMVAHIKNMARGSTQNHTYVLKICSGHFPMNVSVAGGKLVVKNLLGEKVPRVLQLKENTNVKIEGDLVYVTSASKETAGQVSADIEQLTRRPGYDTRIFQDGIYIINKDGKELK
ncbi:50S ribosomal protein L6 [Candidatus Woesearchaeota archaeon]|nr:50S ribosomal protein L6P [uncultured archaeon]MBS3100523.1 50S ribosomal protein L6 [Candidatus Woesearchaeota archaeon]